MQDACPPGPTNLRNPRVLSRSAFRQHATFQPRVISGDAAPGEAVAGAVGVVAEVIAGGEQVIIGSPFEPFNSALHSRLAEAGVSSVLLDGSVSAKRRGSMAARYKECEYSVIVAGLKAMGKGHSFECAKHLFLPSKSWALDENEQFIHRVWRLNSREDVTIYTFTTQNTIDELMDADFGAKLHSAQLGLDGQLIEQEVEEVDLAKLLAKAVRNFDPYAPTIDERDMEREWRSPYGTASPPPKPPSACAAGNAAARPTRPTRHRWPCWPCWSRPAHWPAPRPHASANCGTRPKAWSFVRTDAWLPVARFARKIRHAQEPRSHYPRRSRVAQRPASRARPHHPRPRRGRG